MMKSLMLAQTNLYGAFEVFSYSFGAAIAGVLVGVGTLLASIGFKPLIRSIVLIGVLPVIGIHGFYLIGLPARSAATGLVAAIVIMVAIAMATFYWPDGPRQRSSADYKSPFSGPKPPRF